MDSHDYVTLRDYIDTRMVALERTIQQAIDTQERASHKTEQSLEYRLQGMNEFRASLQDQTRQYVTRSEFESLGKAMRSDIDNLQKLTSYGLGALGAVQFIVFAAAAMWTIFGG